MILYLWLLCDKPVQNLNLARFNLPVALYTCHLPSSNPICALPLHSLDMIRVFAKANRVTLEGGLKGGRDFVDWILTLVGFSELPSLVLIVEVGNWHSLCTRDYLEHIECSFGWVLIYMLSVIRASIQFESIQSAAQPAL